MKKRALEVARNLFAILAVGIIYYFVYRLLGSALKCPTNELTGLLCPGCGLTRMFTSLLALDFSSAIYYNAAFLLLSPLLIAIGISYYYEYIKYGIKSLKKWHKIALIICIAILAAFGVLRNILPIGLQPNF